jgi:MFS family permease
MTDASRKLETSRSAGPAQGFVLIFLASLPTLAIVSLVPNLPQFFTRFHDVPGSEFLVPMIITLPSLCIALFSPLTGAIADFWGRRRLLIAAILMYAIVGVLPFFLSDLYTILAARFAIGIAEAAILACQNALMGDYFEGKQRQHWLGLLSIIGPIIASLLVLAGGQLGAWDWRGPFLLYLFGIPMALWVALVVFEPQAEPKKDSPNPPASTFPWKAARTVALVTTAVAILYFVQAVQLGRMFGDHGILSPAKLGVYVTIASVGVFIGGFAFSLMTKVSVMTRFAIVFIAMGIGYAGLGLTPTAAAAVPFGIVAQFANGMTIPTLIGWALTKFQFEHRGRGMGIWSGCFFAGTFFSPLLVTLLGRITGNFLQTVTVIGLGCLIVAATLFLLERRYTGRNSK